MPLVTDKVSIPFDAESDALIKHSQKVIDELDRVKQATKQNGDLMEQQFKRQNEALEKNKFSWTEFRSMYSSVLDVVQVGAQIWEETAGKYANNAIAVGDLARQLGTTTEEASRLKEVSDDLGVGVDTLSTAFKAAQKDGISPNIEGLAQLSDEYIKLQPGVERSQFLLDKFGKSGLDMAIIMEKGGSSIRAMSAAVDENMIVTQKAYEEARQFKASQDALNDSWDAFTYKVAPPLLNATTDIINSYMDTQRANDILIEQGIKKRRATDDEREAAFKQAVAERESAEAMLLAADASNEATGAFESQEEATQRLAEEAKAAEQAIRDMTQANQRELDIIGNLAKETETYTDKQTDLQAKHAELLAKKNELLAQGYWPEHDAILDINAKLAENDQAMQDNAAEYEMASQRRILARAEELLSIDGLTNAEKEGLIERGIAMGIYTEEAAAKMREEEQAAYDLSAALMSIPTEVITNVYTNYQTATGTPGAYGFSQNTTHAIGGSFEIPQGYGNEGFRMGGGDTASGGEKLTVTPAGQDVIDYKKMARAIRDALMAVG